MKFPLKEIQSTRTQRPTASSSYPYVEITLGDEAVQCTMQLQLEQVGPTLAPACHPACHPLILLTSLFSGSGSRTGQLLAMPWGASSPVQGTELT